MKNEAIFEGGCLCGAVRYRATSGPIRGVICHCGMCRKHSGAPAMSFIHFPKAEFTWTKALPTRYRSSSFAERGFCASCGSTLTMHEDVLTDRVQIALGSLDEPERVRITDHVWAAEQLSWFIIDDKLQRFPGSSTAVPTDAPP